MVADNIDLQGFDFSRAAHDFPYYCANLLHIRTKDRQFRAFNKWWPSQVRIWTSIQKSLSVGEPVRKIILKPRQTGASTLTEGFLFWQVHTRPNTHALVLSMDKDSASVIFEMSRNFYENLPIDWRPLKRYSSKKELVFENPDEKTRPVRPGLRSRIEVQTAGKFVPPRGASFHLVHFSEVAFWPNAEDIIPAIIPMVPDLPGSAIIYESTANGLDNFFHHEWQAAKEGESIFEPIFFPWTVMPEYAHAFHSREERQDFASDLDEEEQELHQRHNLSLEQLKWRRFKIASMKGDVDKFRQEYPSDEREAFIFSGHPIFDRKVLRRIKTRKPIWTGDIDIAHDRVVEDEDGLLDIWEHPQPNGEYVIGVDTCSGSSDDYACMQVLRRTWPQGLADQVAEWHGKVDPVMQGRLAVVLARHYNNAMLSIEINNHGLTTQTEAGRHYWHFYRWQYFDRIGGKSYSQKLGWETNIGTKPILVDRTTACLRDNLVGINSEGLLKEMWEYIRVPGTMSFESESGNDDRVMAFMIALTTLYIEEPEAHPITEKAKTKVEVAQPQLPQIVVSPSAIMDVGDPRGQLIKPAKSWQHL